jgi:hypothetical protein
MGQHITANHAIHADVYRWKFNHQNAVKPTGCTSNSRGT